MLHRVYCASCDKVDDCHETLCEQCLMTIIDFVATGTVHAVQHADVPYHSPTQTSRSGSRTLQVTHFIKTGAALPVCTSVPCCGVYLCGMVWCGVGWHVHARVVGHVCADVRRPCHCVLRVRRRRLDLRSASTLIHITRKPGSPIEMHAYPRR